MVKNYISAKDARNLTENSDKLLNVAFKTIKEAAEYGNNQTQFSVYETDPKVIARIYDNLTDAGYTNPLFRSSSHRKKSACVLSVIRFSSIAFPPNQVKIQNRKLSARLLLSSLR